MGVAVLDNLVERGLRAEETQNLAALPLFSSLSPACLAHITAEASVVRIEAGDVVFHQGEEPTYLHVLLDGQVGLFGGISAGEETVVEIMKQGEVFISAAVLTGRPYLLRAVALQRSRLLQMPAERLRSDLRANPDLAVAMLTSLASHFRLLVREIKNLKLKSAAQRLAIYLMGLTTRREGAAIIRLPHSKSVVAARIGVRAETLSRAFAALKAEGVVSQGSAIHIADLNALAAYCHEGEDEPE